MYEGTGVTREELADKLEYAQVVKMLGNGRLEAKCQDGETRLGQIRGAMRKKVRYTAILFFYLLSAGRVDQVVTLGWHASIRGATGYPRTPPPRKYRP